MTRKAEVLEEIPDMKPREGGPSATVARSIPHAVSVVAKRGENQGRDLMIRSVIALQARAGITTTREQAEAAVDAAERRNA